MGVLSALKGLVGRGDEQYPYECRDCGHEFESTRRRLKKVDCPECGSGLVRDNVV